MPTSKKQTNNSLSLAIMKWPVLWGGVATAAFYIAIRGGHLQHPLITRYFASHPVEYIATTMFFVGLAALLIKFLALLAQPKVTGQMVLGPFAATSIEQCPELLADIDEKPRSIRRSLLGTRIVDAVDYVRRRGSAENLDGHLRGLADQASERSVASYSLVRIVISTIPILGFLGTVIGITRAVAELAQLVGDISFEEAINSVVSGLSVAFDTTALALALSIVLMFAMFFVSRAEAARLAAVEREAEQTLIGRFESTGGGEDPGVLAIRQIGMEVFRHTDTLVERQAEIWNRSIESANERWSVMATTTEKQLETALSRALHSSARAHAELLEAAEERARDDRREILQITNDAAGAAAAQQQEMSRQTELLLGVVNATEQVLKLEETLNGNLQALRQSGNFDQAINSLAAAISLLNSRLGQTPDLASPVRLGRSATPEEAA